MTKPKYASPEERKAARSAKARKQMLDQWAAKQDTPGYFGKHRRVRTARGPAKLMKCSCGKPALHWAQIHGMDGTDPSHYLPMCQPCHWKYDDIPNRLVSTPARKQAARDWWALKTPEERHAIAMKGVATREARRVALDSSPPRD